MKLLEPTPISVEQAHVLATRLGLPGPADLQPITPAGMINSVYVLNDALVLRIPRNHPFNIAQLHREVAAIPAALAAGLSTADIVLFDSAQDMISSPYLVVERLRGRNLEAAGLDPRSIADAWRALGRDLGRLHAAPLPAGLVELPPDEYDAILSADPFLLVDQRAVEGWFSALEAGWLLRWLDRLAPCAAPDLPRALVHADVQMSNILLAEATDDYLALIDWGCARCAESTMDFLSMPLAAVPHLLEGHREVAPMADDGMAEGRILWRRLQLLLGVLPRGAARDCGWGERPTAWLIDLMRFFLNPPSDRWRAVGPPD